MTREEFINYIESIGFKDNGSDFYHYYKQYRINTYFISNCYSFYNGSEWIHYIDFDLTPLKKMTRCIKLKQLLR